MSAREVWPVGHSLSVKLSQSNPIEFSAKRTAPRLPRLSLRRTHRPAEFSRDDLLAPRVRRERTTMEGESQGSGVDQHMKDTMLKRRFRKGAEMEKHEVQTSPQVYAQIG